MMKRIFGSFILFALFATGCGDETDDAEGSSSVVTTLTPKEAIAEVKLHLEKFRTYYYCELTFPQECDDLPIAYVLPREGSEPYRIVFFSNQDRDSTWVEFDYVTVDAESSAIATVGQFLWFSGTGTVETKGTALWGVPR